MSRQAGNYRELSTPIISENLNLRKAILACSGALPENRARPFPAGLVPEGEAMLAQQFHEAAAAVRTTAQLDMIARQLWVAHGEGHLADADAEALSEVLQARRAAFACPAVGVPVARAAAASAPRRPAPRSPDRQASLERRRRQATSGVVPSKIAASFTTGETAALSVIARAVQKSGICILPIDAIAALAGTSRTTVQNALRLAERLGLIQRRERRRAGQRSLPSILRIVSREWTAWLRLSGGGGGFRTLSTTDNQVFSKGKVAEKCEHRASSTGAKRRNVIRMAKNRDMGGKAKQKG